jgi:serine/threonine-protein kinase PknG
VCADDQTYETFQESQQGFHNGFAGERERPVTACLEPGCDGTIDADGYCDTCGTAAAPAAARAAAGAGQASSRTSNSARTYGTRSSSTSTSSRNSSSVSSRTRGSRGGSTGRSRRGNLGAGLIEVPPVPYQDPMTAIMTNPQVPEGKRYCSNCSTPVGRGQNGLPGRTEGFCRKCRTAFSFEPKLHAGDNVGQYEVLGCIAHGGLGWIYLAKDKNVSDRWVVLKGLLDSGDADAMAAAAAERKFLAEVNHPSIVQIMNFVQHPDAKTGAPVGYIVMEYVGGSSLKQIRTDYRDPRGQAGPLPVAQAIAYAIEILPAFGYLHGLGLVYNDFKPDNIIQSEEQLKLIDMGGVIHMDDQDSAIYGTKGFQAPEIADEGPSVESDLYTVGRTLAVLTSLETRAYQSTYLDRLPTPQEVPLFARHESFYKLLQRATHADPGLRFGSADQMAQQLTAVLREVLSLEEGKAHPGASAMFGPEVRVPSTTALSPEPAAVVRALPVPLVDRDDPGAQFLAGLGAVDLGDQRVALENSPLLDRSQEIQLRLVLAATAAGDFAEGVRMLDRFEEANGADWRTFWYRGLLDLAAGQLTAAQEKFEAVYDALPGEAAPKLSLAACAEIKGDFAAAAAFYGTVWRTDNGYVSAAFGLARSLLRTGQRDQAVAVFGSVPQTSTHHTAAAEAALRALLVGRDNDLTGADLADIDTRYSWLAERLDPEHASWLALDVLSTAGTRLTVQVPKDLRSGQQLIKRNIDDRSLREGMEHAYRSLARLATDRTKRIELVDQANAVRPRTLI